jgi:hypothetical protein
LASYKASYSVSVITTDLWGFVSELKQHVGVTNL